MTKKESPCTYTVPAVARAVELLEYIGEHDSQTLQQVVEATGLPKTSVYSILQTLTHSGLLRQGHKGGYSLGLKLFALGSKAVSQLDIRAEASPVMYDLMHTSQLTVFLATLHDNEGIYMGKVDGPRSVATRTWVGKRLNLSSTSLGKVLLAWKSESAIRAVLASQSFERHTPNTITDMKTFVQHLTKVREQGWAIDNEENMPFIRCVAAPIFGVDGSVAAAISVSGHTEQFTIQDVEKHALSVRQAARRITELLGFPATPWACAESEQL